MLPHITYVICAISACLLAHAGLGCASCSCKVLCEQGTFALARASKVLCASAGLDEPDAGTVVRRKNTSVGFLAQAGALLFSGGLYALATPTPAWFPDT